MLGKFIQDSLPPLTLLFNRMFRFRIEVNSHSDTMNQLLVRHTWISMLLNGKRHPRSALVTPAGADLA